MVRQVSFSEFYGRTLSKKSVFSALFRFLSEFFFASVSFEGEEGVFCMISFTFSGNQGFNGKLASLGQAQLLVLKRSYDFFGTKLLELGLAQVLARLSLSM